MKTIYIFVVRSVNLNERVVLYFEISPRIVIEPQVDFFLLPTTNLLVALITNFLADQDIMRCVGGGLTLHVGEKTLGRFISRNMNLNGIINIYTDQQGRSKTMRCN